MFAPAPPSPIDIASIFQGHTDNFSASWIFTSATLSVRKAHQRRVRLPLSSVTVASADADRRLATIRHEPIPALDWPAMETVFAVRADVPVVGYLSGGVDSAYVLANASKVRGSPVPSFTIQVPGKGLDEKDDALVTARHLGSRRTSGPGGFATWTRATFLSTGGKRRCWE